MMKRKLIGRKKQRPLHMSAVYNKRSFVDCEDAKLQQLDMRLRRAIQDKVARERYVREALAGIEAEIKKHEETQDGSAKRV